jgi:hypothetical protein
MHLTFKEATMRKCLWLAVSPVLFLTGCTDIFSPCAHPGAMSVLPASGAKISPNELMGGPSQNCLYGLDIKSINKESGEVKATVAEAEIDRNRNRMNDYFSRQLFSTSWFTDFKKEDFPLHVYAFKVQNTDDLNHIREGDRDITFEGIPGTHFLSLCGEACIARRQEQCREYYSKETGKKILPEDKKCGEMQATPKP